MMKNRNVSFLGVSLALICATALAYVPVASVLKGGTGRSTLTSGALLTGNGTSAIGMITQLTSNTFLPSLGQQVSSSSGSFSTASVSYVDVTNLTVTITTTGRPVFFLLQSASGSTGTVGCSNTGGPTATCSVQLLRDGATAVNPQALLTSFVGPTSNIHQLPPSVFSTIDTGASAGSHTWKVQGRVTSGTSFEASGVVLYGYEL